MAFIEWATKNEPPNPLITWLISKELFTRLNVQDPLWRISSIEKVLFSLQILSGGLVNSEVFFNRFTLYTAPKHFS